MFKFCPNCGTKNEGWKICPECGTPLERPNGSQSDTAARIEDLSALARAAVLEKQRQLAREQEEAALAQRKKLLASFEYDEHADGTYTVTKLKDRSAPVITVPEKVVAIADGAFEGCDKLRKVILPEGLSDIGANAFRGCARLMEITMPKSLLAIEAGAFRGCTLLSEVLFPQGANPLIEKDAFDETCIYGHSQAEIEQIRADRKQREEEEARRRAEEAARKRREEEEARRRAEEAARKRREEEERKAHLAAGFEIENGILLKYKGSRSIVEIPQGVTKIGGSAFMVCESLQQVTIPSSVTEICDGDWFFGVSTGAFWGCSNLTQITIPNSVTEIGDGAFVKCSSLTQVTIPNSVEKIGESAFNGCSSLTQVTIPNSVKEIGEDAFDGCSSLTQVTIPNSVKEIGKWAFDGCSSLTIYCQATSEPDGWEYNWNCGRPVVWGYKK